MFNCRNPGIVISMSPWVNCSSALQRPIVTELPGKGPSMTTAKQLASRQRDQRKKFLIDKNTQYGIARGIIAFWLTGILIVTSFPLLAMAVYGTLIAQLPTSTVIAELIDAAWFPCVTSLLFIPIGVWYSIRFSNRIAGPIFRINREMRRLNDGEESNEVWLRDNDFFGHLGNTYNATRDRILSLEQRIRELETATKSKSGKSESAGCVLAPAVFPVVTGVDPAENGTFQAPSSAFSG